MTVTLISNNTGADFSGQADLELTESAPTTNNNGATGFYNSLYGTGDRRFALIKFTGTTGIAAGQTVSAVTFSLYQDGNGGASARVFQLKAGLRNWSQTQATYNVYTTGNNWTTAGALSDGNDRSSTVSASLATGTVDGAYINFTGGAGMISDVQGVIDGGSNFGWQYGFNTETVDAGHYWHFIGGADTDGSLCPKLTVTHAAAATTKRFLSLLGAGA